MTTQTPAPTAPPAPTPTTNPTSPLPHLPWLLRLHRPALLTWTTLTLALAVALLLLQGPVTDAAATAWQQYDACTGNGPCTYDQSAIVLHRDWYTYLTIALNTLPFLAAAWSGAALFGREMESGTARLTWSLGLSPTRWLTGKLLVSGAVLTAGSALLLWLHRLAWTAGRHRVGNLKSWYDGPTLLTNGPTTAALILTGLAAGALAGLLLRRTLPALLLATAVTGAVRLAFTWVLPYLWPAKTATSSFKEGYEGVGLEVSHGLTTERGVHITDPGCWSTADGICSAEYDRLGATGYYRTYHPEPHFWPLQLTGTALLLATTALLTLAAYRVLRRSTGSLATHTKPKETAPA